MKGINVHSEIRPLKKVLLHRPGRELLNLTPDTLEELLFDDIPFLKGAQAEHDAFAQVLKDNGVEVVYLEDLMAEVLEKNPDVKSEFLQQYIAEAGIRTSKYKRILFNYLNAIEDTKQLVLKTMEGINLHELPRELRFIDNSLVDMVFKESTMLVKPMPNLYFTRDPFESIGNGYGLNRMYSATRSRETIYAQYIFRYHRDFVGTESYYDRTDAFHIEGGDVLNLNENTVIVGISQRTEPAAIELLAKNLFRNPRATVATVYALLLPESRAFMHLDTVCTQVDVDKFTIHPGIMDTLKIFRLEPTDNPEKLLISKVDKPLKTVLAEALGVEDVTLIECGGGDHITSAREQWNDGSNTLCIAPGKVVVYERNNVTNEILKKNGITVMTIPSGELSRGRGGPRCMSMPLWRED